MKTLNTRNRYISGLEPLNCKLCGFIYWVEHLQETCQPYPKEHWQPPNHDGKCGFICVNSPLYNFKENEPKHKDRTCKHCKDRGFKLY